MSHFSNLVNLFLIQLDISRYDTDHCIVRFTCKIHHLAAHKGFHHFQCVSITLDPPRTGNDLAALRVDHIPKGVYCHNRPHHTPSTEVDAGCADA